MGLMSIVVKGVMETRKAKALARLNHEHASEMAQMKTQAATVRKGASSPSDIKQLHDHMQSIQQALDHHSELLHDILNALLH